MRPLRTVLEDLTDVQERLGMARQSIAELTGDEPTPPPPTPSPPPPTHTPKKESPHIDELYTARVREAQQFVSVPSCNRFSALDVLQTLRKENEDACAEAIKKSHCSDLIERQQGRKDEVIPTLSPPTYETQSFINHQLSSIDRCIEMIKLKLRWDTKDDFIRDYHLVEESLVDALKERPSKTKSSQTLEHGCTSSFHAMDARAQREKHAQTEATRARARLSQERTMQNRVALRRQLEAEEGAVRRAREREERLLWRERHARERERLKEFIRWKRLEKRHAEKEKEAMISSVMEPVERAMERDKDDVIQRLADSYEALEELHLIEREGRGDVLGPEVRSYEEAVLEAADRLKAMRNGSRQAMYARKDDCIRKPCDIVAIAEAQAHSLEELRAQQHQEQEALLRNQLAQQRAVHHQHVEEMTKMQGDVFEREERQWMNEFGVGNYVTEGDLRRAIDELSDSVKRQLNMG